MKKIVLLPLDERPCNYIYPQQLFNNEEITTVLPPMEIMGNRKQPGDHEKIVEFLMEETKDAYGLVISIDTFLYGGIVPSRLHYFTVEQLKERLAELRKIKENNPNLMIYASHLIMRCPQLSLSFEEPDYYAECGKEIFKYGYFKHRKELGNITPEEEKEFAHLEATLNMDYLKDFTDRRYVNTSLNVETLNLVEDKIIDFLIIPQDDASEFGWTAMDQRRVNEVIIKKELQLRVYMYPGADEVGNTLICKMLLKIENKRPLFYIKYNSINAPLNIPLLEDRNLDLTIRYQILAAGGLITTSVAEADIVLFVNSNGVLNIFDPTTRDNYLPQDRVTTFRNMPEFIEFMDYCVNDLNKKVCVADTAFVNRGDFELIKMLEQKDLLFKVAAYAGWNTSSNTLGTCIPHSMINYLYGDTKAHFDFLVSRYIEDYVYMAHIRKIVSERLIAKGLDPHNLEAQRSETSKEVQREIESFVEKNLPGIKDHYVIEDLYMPWRRMFEIGLKVSYK